MRTCPRRGAAAGRAQPGERCADEPAGTAQHVSPDPECVCVHPARDLAHHWNGQETERACETLETRRTRVDSSGAGLARV